jgi:hypothetical protein
LIRPNQSANAVFSASVSDAASEALIKPMNNKDERCLVMVRIVSEGEDRNKWISAFRSNGFPSSARSAILFAMPRLLPLL